MVPPPRGRPPREDRRIHPVMGLPERICYETEDHLILPGGCPRGGGGAPKSVSSVNGVYAKLSHHVRRILREGPRRGRRPQGSPYRRSGIPVSMRTRPNGYPHRGGTGSGPAPSRRPPPMRIFPPTLFRRQEFSGSSSLPFRRTDRQDLPCQFRHRSPVDGLRVLQRSRQRVHPARQLLPPVPNRGPCIGHLCCLRL